MRKHYVTVIETIGLYYKNIAIVNDNSRVISERHHNLERHLQSSIMLLESSITLLENIYSKAITNDDRNKFIVQTSEVATFLFS
jgi:deoxyxylulose-5-phosphate synthase